MNEAQLREIIYAGLRKAAPGGPVNELDDDENIREVLDIDSFDSLNFLIGLNEATGVDIKEKDYGKLNTVRQILDYLMVKV